VTQALISMPVERWTMKKSTRASKSSTSNDKAIFYFDSQGMYGEKKH